MTSDLGGARRGQAAGGRLRPLWHPGEPHQRPPQVRGQGPHCGQQQCRSVGNLEQPGTTYRTITTRTGTVHTFPTDTGYL